MDGIEFLISLQSVKLDGRDIYLTPFEFRIFWVLVHSEKDYLTREEISKRVYGSSKCIPAKVVVTHIINLRKKTKDSGILITTSYGEGYGVHLKGSAEGKKEARAVSHPKLRKDYLGRRILN